MRHLPGQSLGLLLVLLSAPWTARAAEATFTQSAQRIEQVVKQLAATPLVSPSGNKQQRSLLVCSLPAALAGADCWLQLSDSGSRVEGLLIAPAWNAGVHPVSVTNWKRTSSKLSGQLQIRLQSDGMRPAPGKEIIWPLFVEMTITGTKGELVGAARSKGSTAGWPAIPASDPDIEGVWLQAAGGRTIPQPPMRTDPCGAYAWCQWMGWYVSQAYALHRLRVQAETLGGEASPVPLAEAFPAVAAASAASKATPEKKPKKPKRVKKEKQADDLGLDELLDEPDVDEVASADSAGPARLPSIPAPRLQAFAVVAQAMADLAERQWRLMHSKYQPGSAPSTLDVGDERFGPFYGSAALPVDATGAARLPKAEPETKAQNWPYVAHWQLLTKVPRRQLDASSLPWLLATRQARYVLPPAAADEDPRQLHWQAREVLPGSGLLHLPVPREGGQQCYASAVVHVAAAGTYYMGASIWGRGAVWVNDRCIMATRAGGGEEQHLLQQVNLQAGANAILVSCQPQGPRAWIGLRFCTAGKPQAGRKRDTTSLAPQGVDAYRANGTAAYPDAHPPTAWDLEKGHNVRWRLRTMGFSKAAPLVIGDKVVTMEEPDRLICCHALTGEVLWRSQVNVQSLIAADAVADLEQRYQRYVDAVTAAWADRPEAASFGKGMPRSVSQAWGAYLGKLKQVTKARPVTSWDGHNGGPWAGYTFATPVTDGSYIWVKSALGGTACFDLDGNRRWLVHTVYKGGGNFHNLSSPALAPQERLLLVQNIAPRASKGEQRLDTLIAYDADSGQQRWTAQVNVRLTSVSPQVVHVPGTAGPMELIVCNGGTVVRAKDGKILVANNPGSGGTLGMTLADDLIVRHGQKYIIGTGSRLHYLSDDCVGMERVWTTAAVVCAGGWAYRHGLCYSLMGSQFGGPYRLLNPRTGRLLPQSYNAGVRGVGAWDRRIGDAFVPTVATRDHVYLAMRSQRGNEHGRDFHRSFVTVAQNGTEGCFVAHNAIEATLTAAFVADQDRLYVRNDGFLTCFGLTGETGKAYEVRQNTRLLLQELDLVPRLHKDLISIPALPGKSGRMDDMRWGSPLSDPGRVLLAGPYTDEPAVLKEARTWRSGQTCGTQALRQAEKQEREAWGAVWRHRPASVNVSAALGAESGLGLVVMVRQLGQAGSYRVVVSDPDARLRCNGQELVHGDCVRLSAGAFTFSAMVPLGADRVPFCLQLLPCLDPGKDEQAWKAAIRRAEPIFTAYRQLQDVDQSLLRRMDALLGHIR